MDENIRCFALLFVSLVVYEYDGICGEFSPLSKNYLTCLIDAATFHSDLQTSFCVGSNPDLNIWHQTPEECNKICTITTQNLSCSDPDKFGMAQFQFDINLPRNAYTFGKCKSCFNITQINITCMLNKTSMKFEPHSTQDVEVTTSKMIYEPHSTQDEEVTTLKMIYEPCSTQTEEIPSKMISKSSGDKVEIIVAAVVSGTVFGVLITIGVWILKGKLSKENLWKGKFIAQRPTTNESPKLSHSEPVVSIENQYLEINPQNNFESSHYTCLTKSYSQTEESSVYDHPN